MMFPGHQEDCLKPDDFLFLYVLKQVPIYVLFQETGETLFFREAPAMFYGQITWCSSRSFRSSALNF